MTEQRHGHLWHLSDGTGLHAPPAALVIDPETRRLCCHLCGLWFRSLGSHVRAHGHTADSYRGHGAVPRAGPDRRHPLRGHLRATA